MQGTPMPINASSNIYMTHRRLCTYLFAAPQLSDFGLVKMVVEDGSGAGSAVGRDARTGTVTHMAVGRGLAARRAHGARACWSWGDLAPYLVPLVLSVHRKPRGRTWRWVAAANGRLIGRVPAAMNGRPWTVALGIAFFS